MKQREFKKINASVSEIGLGTWQLGTKWGEAFNPDEALKILETAAENKINFIDTADIYNDGNSEKAIGQFMKNVPTDFFVSTKCGRGLNPHTAQMYTPEAVENFANHSLKRLQVERLDMLLLHCRPTSVYKKDEIFMKLDKIQQAGKIRSYGVSVEKVSEALTAAEYPITAVEIIFNMFRLKPKEIFSTLQEKNIGVIARVPLASGLLTGKYTKDTTFSKADHRSYNRHGEAFDKGETFSGVDYDLGLEAVKELKKLFQTDNLIPYALKWILMHEAVTTVIPGASKNSQVISNVAAAAIPDLTSSQMAGVEKIYNHYLKSQVHSNW